MKSSETDLRTLRLNINPLSATEIMVLIFMNKLFKSFQPSIKYDILLVVISTEYLSLKQEQRKTTTNV